MRRALVLLLAVLLIAYYCCDDATRPGEECDYTCGKAFKRTGGGWKLVDEYSPC